MQQMIDWLKSAVPEFVADDAMLDAYYTAVAPELVELREYVQTLPMQLWPHTATWSLERFEWIFGITPAPGLTLEERRNLVLAKMLAARTSTIPLLRSIIAVLSGEGATLSAYPREILAWVKMAVDNGRPAYLAALKAAIEYVMPAHFEVQYILYGKLSWGELAQQQIPWGAVGAEAIPWGELQFRKNGMKKLFWKELGQNIWKYGEITWGALSGRMTWEELPDYDLNSFAGEDNLSPDWLNWGTLLKRRISWQRAQDAQAQWGLIWLGRKAYPALL